MPARCTSLFCGELVGESEADWCHGSVMHVTCAHSFDSEEESENHLHDIATAA